MHSRAFTLALAASLLWWVVGVSVHAQGTAFTYQGFLERSGDAISGVCDLEIGLYGAAEGGAPLETQFFDGVAVDRGRFTVELDFGAIPDADDRWLGTSVVCPSGSGALSVLSPRQQLTAAPYSLFAHRAGAARWQDLTGMPSGFADGTDDDTTYTAGVGMTLLDRTFEVNSSVIQQRVGGRCGAGSAISEVKSDGSVVCEVDDDHIYGAGLGLTLEGPTFSVATDAIQRRVGGICPVGRSIRAIDENGAVTCDSGGDITSVTAGKGLSGGGESGAVTLAVDFSGSGESSTVSHSDHEHLGQIWSGDGAGGLQVQNGAAVATLGAMTYAGPPAIVSGVPTTIAVGVLGQVSSSGGFGVAGAASSLSGASVGVHGETLSTGGVGVEGEALSQSGSARGVRGVSAADGGVGVLGEATSESASPGAVPVGVRGESTSGVGVVGVSFSDSGVGVAGSGFVGVAGDTDSRSGKAVFGRASADIGTAVGVYGEAESPSGFGGSFVNQGLLGPGLRAQSGAGGFDIVLGGTSSGGSGDDGVISTDPLWLQGDMMLLSYDDVEIHLNQDDGNETSNFWIRDGADDAVFRVTDTGQVFADGTFHPGGADVAELLPAVAGLEEGDVVVIGPSGRLQASSGAYQTSVAGVYSSRPGLLGGRGTANDTPESIPLAVLGVVAVKASAENGAIVAGDLLTTAATPGHAMRCGDAAACTGSLVGKALGALDAEAGSIEMLVSLH